jgi:hypothetical protein
MKKLFLVIILNVSFLSIAQEMTTTDALRYAVENMNGTARFRGMSGAFGAVGGDLSSININPAGSLFFNNNFANVDGELKDLPTATNSNLFIEIIAHKVNKFLLYLILSHTYNND